MQLVQLKRREFITLLGGGVAMWPLAPRAQQAAKTPRIGFLIPGRSQPPDAALKTVSGFLQGLHDLGYRDGQNIIIERRFAEWNLDLLRQFAAEMVRSNVDIIVALSTPAARAAKQATSAIPIVAIGMADPVADDLVASLARPGGNVSGTTFLGP
jgi:putative ABC transport system substrate-binding protein